MKSEKKTGSGKNATAVEMAYKYLSSRMRSVSETKSHLAGKGYSEEEIQSAVAELKELGYLDDYQYALRYYEYNREKKRGTLRAARELADKGIDPETVRNAGEDFRYETGLDEFEDALELARKELRIRSKDLPDEDAELRITDDKMAGAIARKLETRGFARDIIFRVLDRLR